MSMQNEAVLERALTIGWTTFKRAWPLMVVATLVALAAGIPPGIASQIVQVVGLAVSGPSASADSRAAVALSAMAVSVVLSACIQWPAQAGLLAAATCATRGRVQQFGTIFAGFRRFGTVFVANFLVAAINFALFLPLALVTWDVLWPWASSGFTAIPSFAALNIPITLAVGALTAVVQLWVTARLSLVMLRVVDPDQPRVGALDAIRFSIERTRGNTLNAVGILILSVTIATLGLIACCVGLVLFGMPLAATLQAGLYRALLNDPDPQPAASAPAWLGSTPPQAPL